MIEDVIIRGDRMYVMYEDGSAEWLSTEALKTGAIRWKPVGEYKGVNNGTDEVKNNELW